MTEKTIRILDAKVSRSKIIGAQRQNAKKPASVIRRNFDPTVYDSYVNAKNR